MLGFEIHLFFIAQLSKFFIIFFLNNFGIFAKQDFVSRLWSIYSCENFEVIK